IIRFVRQLRRLKRAPNRRDLEEALDADSAFLDICRLFLGVGQEPAAHMICDQLGGSRMNWSPLRRLAAQDPVKMARVMVALGIPGLIEQHFSRKWKVE